jgi:threonine/homoserine/homoserine lactone efflux protein
MPSQLIIKSHNPWKFWVKMILVATAFGLVAWIMYIYGGDRAGYNNRMLQNEQRRLQKQCGAGSINVD